jgi:hypothetical protein
VDSIRCISISIPHFDMARYYFDVSDGHYATEDIEGMEIANDAGAEKEAITAAVSMARDAFPSRATEKLVVRVRRELEVVFEATVSLQIRSD